MVVAASQCFVLPSGISYEDSAAIPANYLTAYFCVLDIGHIRAGQSIFISSCAGTTVNELFSYLMAVMYDRCVNSGPLHLSKKGLFALKFSWVVSHYKPF